jgi:hypothetical protein
VSSPATPASLSNGYPQTLTWTLVANQTGSIPISVSATAQNSGSASAAATILVNPLIAVPPSAYVPPPVPAISNYDVGVYYFPGWGSYASWDPIRDFPERTPALGYYAEGDPQVSDWQIKWAVEHGIKFFAVDWYWSGSGPARLAGYGEQPNSFFQGYFSSVYHDYIKFCIAYANDHAEETPGSVAAFLTIAQSWIGSYFSRPEYYQLNQTPVVIVLNPAQLDASLGGSAKEALDAARQLARSAGLNGIYFIAATNPTQVNQFLSDGYDALSAYNYNGAGASDPDESPYSAMVAGYASTWDRIIAASAVPYIIPTSPGFDLRPWATSTAPYELVRTGSTADQFQQMLQMAKDRIDAGNSPPVVMVEAWNELGEGSYVEPTAGRGFTYLDAIRSVFADNSPHLDLVPSDAGLPIIETQQATTLWTFTNPSDLAPYASAINISNSKIVNGQWMFDTANGADIVRTGFDLSALEYTGVTIRLSVSADANLHLYWGPADEPGPSTLRGIGFSAKAGPIQTYTLTLAGNAGWRGIVNLLRLTTSPTNMTVVIESIQFIPSSTAVSIAASAPRLQFTWTAGTPAPQTISLASASRSSLSWTATTNAPWLALSALSGTAPANLGVSVNPAALEVFRLPPLAR